MKGGKNYTESDRQKEIKKLGLKGPAAKLYGIWKNLSRKNMKILLKKEY